jgi:hypothetical protein
MPEIRRALNDMADMVLSVRFTSEVESQGWIEDGPAFHFSSPHHPRLPMLLTMSIGGITYADLKAFADAESIHYWLRQMEKMVTATSQAPTHLGFDSLSMPFLDWQTRRFESDGSPPTYKMTIMIDAGFLYLADGVFDEGPAMVLWLGQPEMLEFATRLRVQFDQSLEQAGFDPDAFALGSGT